MAKANLPLYPASDEATLWRNLITAVGGNGPGTDTTMNALQNAFAAALYAQQGVAPSLGIAPTGALAENISRYVGNESETIAAATGTLYLEAIYVPAGTIVSNVNFVTGSTGSTGVTHNWAVLCDSGRVPLATSADNTSTDLVADTVQAYALVKSAAGTVTSFTTTYSGLYYAGFMIAQGTTAPTMVGYTGAAATLAGIVPKLCGSSNTSATVPPTFPATARTAITALADGLYCYLT